MIHHSSLVFFYYCRFVDFIHFKYYIEFLSYYCRSKSISRRLIFRTVHSIFRLSLRSKPSLLGSRPPSVGFLLFYLPVDQLSFSVGFPLDSALSNRSQEQQRMEKPITLQQKAMQLNMEFRKRVAWPCRNTSGCRIAWKGSSGIRSRWRGGSRGRRWRCSSLENGLSVGVWMSGRPGLVGVGGWGWVFSKR